MSGHRGVLAAVALLLLAAVPACSYADDNYQNAQKALDRSNPNLTVPETVTTMKPFQTIPNDAGPSDSIPVELATPAQRAAALADAAQKAADRQAGRTGPFATMPDGTPVAGAAGAVAGSNGGPATGGTQQGGGGAGGTQQGGGVAGGGTVPVTVAPKSPLCLGVVAIEETGSRLNDAVTSDSPTFPKLLSEFAGSIDSIRSLAPDALQSQIGGVKASLTFFIVAAASRPVSEVTALVRGQQADLVPKMVALLDGLRQICPE